MNTDNPSPSSDELDKAIDIDAVSFRADVKGESVYVISYETAKQLAEQSRELREQLRICKEAYVRETTDDETYAKKLQQQSRADKELIEKFRTALENCYNDHNEPDSNQGEDFKLCECARCKEILATLAREQGYGKK